MVRVTCASHDARQFTGGLDTLEVQASSVRTLIRELDRRYPGMGEHVREKMALAIDGEIYQDVLDAPLPPGSEVALIPRIAGG